MAKQRVSSKVDELPEEVRLKVDAMIADVSNTYTDISAWLKGQGYAISKSSIGRYAYRTQKAMQRLMEAQAQTDRMLQVMKENPNADYPEAAIRLTLNGLVNRMATAEEEWDAMPLDKAGRLIASLSRTKVYKDKVRQEMRKRADVALAQMEGELMKLVRQDEGVKRKLHDVLMAARERMVTDD